MVSSLRSEPTACLALADGTVFYGNGFGAPGEAVAELCFNTAMTGYQEIMTDPSYCGQIITFTFPHIGNVGVNNSDDEAVDPVAAGMVVKWDPTRASNWRAQTELSDWLRARGRIAIGGIDTSRLTRVIRQQGAPHVAIAYHPEGNIDREALIAKARGFNGLEGMDWPKRSRAAKPITGMRNVGPGKMGTSLSSAPNIKLWRLIMGPSVTFYAVWPLQAVMSP